MYDALFKLIANLIERVVGVSLDRSILAKPGLHKELVKLHHCLSEIILLSSEVIDDLESESGLFNAQYMTRMARIALMPPKAMRCRPSETL